MKPSLIILFFLFTANLSYGEDKARDLNVFDYIHKRITGKWKNLNKSVDVFFAGDNYEEELNESYIRFNFIYKRSKGSSEGAEYNFRLQTDFPNTSKEIKLIVEKESNKNKGEGFGNQDSDLSSVADTNRVSDAFDDNRYSAAGRWNFLKTEGWKAHTDLGMRFDVPFDPFIKFRARKKISFTKSHLNLVQKVSYFRIDELDHGTDIDYLKPLSEILKFRFLNIFTYRRTERFYRFANSFILMRKHSDKVSMSYSVGVSGESEPVYAYNNYSISSSMRRLLYGKWLYGQVMMGLNFPRDYRFTPRSFSLWELEAFF